MNLYIFSIGLIITVLTIYDLVYTILSPKGAGFIADYIARKIWRLSLFLCNHNGTKRFLSFVGPFIILIIVLSWIHLLWIGNTLIIYSDPEAVYSTDTNNYITDFSENLYYTGYVLSSMGNGDYTPQGRWWQFFTGFISFSGVVFISLAISFLLPVVEAVALKRRMALKIFSFGENPIKILRKYKNDEFKELYSSIENLQENILKLAEYHLAYPVIHYFHANTNFESLPLNFVKLDEVLTHLLSSKDRPEFSDSIKLEGTRQSLTFYLSTLESAFIKPSDDEPERPNKDNTPEEILRDIDTNHYNEGTLVYRRKLLLAYLQNDGWTWDDMISCEQNINLE